MLTQPAIKQMSRVCVSVFLPCLVASKLAKGLTWAKFMAAWPMPLFCWAQIGTACLIGLFVRRLVNPPKHLWRPFLCAITFQNSSALPLVIVQSLSEHPPFNQVAYHPAWDLIVQTHSCSERHTTERERCRDLRADSCDGKMEDAVVLYDNSASSVPAQ